MPKYVTKIHPWDNGQRRPLPFADGLSHWVVLDFRRLDWSSAGKWRQEGRLRVQQILWKQTFWRFLSQLRTSSCFSEDLETWRIPTSNIWRWYWGIPFFQGLCLAKGQSHWKYPQETSDVQSGDDQELIGGSEVKYDQGDHMYIHWNPPTSNTSFSYFPYYSYSPNVQTNFVTLWFASFKDDRSQRNGRQIR